MACKVFSNFLHTNYVRYIYIWGNAVAQLVETLRYKPEGRWFDSRSRATREAE
jgi:hypothetical protein